MSDRNNAGHGQLVTEGELDGMFDKPEEAERNMALDDSQSQAVNGATPDSDVHGGILQGLAITAASGAVVATVALGTCKDELGQRINLPAQATVTLSNAGDCPEGVYDNSDPLNLCVGDGADIVSSVPAGQRVVVSLFLVYDEDLTDQRVDASGTPYYFQEAESFHFHLAVGTAFAASPAAPPSRAVLADGKVLLTDLMMTNNGGTLEMVAAGVLNSNENWDDLGTWYEDNTGRRSDWLACDEATDFPRYDSESVELRVRSAREGLYELVKQLHGNGAISGADLLGSSALTGGLTAGYNAWGDARNLTAGDLWTQLGELTNMLRHLLYRGGENILRPQVGLNGIDYNTTNLEQEHRISALYAAPFVGDTGPCRIDGRKYGFNAKAHPFFDDMFYSAILPTTADNATPWIFATLSGNGNQSVPDIPGGVVQLSSSATAGECSLVTGNGTNKWWTIGASPSAVFMVRFRLPVLANGVKIAMGFFTSTYAAADSAAYVELINGGDDILKLYGRNASGASTAVELNDTNDDTNGTPLSANTWYTLRMTITRNSGGANSIVTAQVNNETWKTTDLAVPAGSFGTSGHHILLYFNGTAGESLQIDQVYAADGQLAPDMY